jgi:hypothetical protein
VSQKTGISVTLLVVTAAFCGCGKSEPPATYARKDETIPMRDGVRLHTRIFNPLSSGLGSSGFAFRKAAAASEFQTDFVLSFAKDAVANRRPTDNTERNIVASDVGAN